MRKLECFYLLMQLLFIEFKTLILALKMRYLLLKRSGLINDKRMLVVKKGNAFLQYRSRAMLANQFFNTVEESHESPNAQAQPQACRSEAEARPSAGATGWVARLSHANGPRDEVLATPNAPCRPWRGSLRDTKAVRYETPTVRHPGD